MAARAAVNLNRDTGMAARRKTKQLVHKFCFCIKILSKNPVARLSKAIAAEFRVLCRQKNAETKKVRHAPYFAR